jgi:hypothetical protein
MMMASMLTAFGLFTSAYHKIIMWTLLPLTVNEAPSAMR